MTLSRKRTAVRTRSSSAARSSAASGVKARVTNARQIDRAQQAGAVGRQGLLAAGIGGVDLFAVAEIVLAVDAVDEDDAGLGVVIGGAHDALPQTAGRDFAIDLALEYERPGRVLRQRRP